MTDGGWIGLKYKEVHLGTNDFYWLDETCKLSSRSQKARNSPLQPATALNSPQRPSIARNSPLQPAIARYSPQQTLYLILCYHDPTAAGPQQNICLARQTFCGRNCCGLLRAVVGPGANLALKPVIST
ncbi:ceruloplasmin [Plakobranchus ocellatus]|uniref:Ceruloplasmin n=1 Tax=Plakobranchus ocellatus TaxID=259542 RepID=A0AAV4D6X8_9GAST|nr:ceruloplasmin [Plakobranchus ocellatus]